MKTCTKCGETKALTEFHKKKIIRDGLDTQCKSCKSEAGKAYYQANRERILASSKAWRGANLERAKATKKANYEANKEEILARQKAWREAHPEKMKARWKTYREARREKMKTYRETNREKIKAQEKAYREANKEKIKARKRSPAAKFSQYRRSAKTRNIPFLLTEEEFKGFWQAPCTYCGVEIETIGLDRVDSSGPYHIDNVVPCCWPCNQNKGTQTLEEWTEITLARAKRLNPEEFNK